MLLFLKDFCRDERGAVTVDWVVLTAAMTGFGVAVTIIIINAANHPAEGMGAALAAMTINP